MPHFSEQFIDELKNRLDAVSLIGTSVDLVPSGKSYKGRCPFHQEKTPSFHVYPADQRFHCFGCGVSGTMFDFVMREKGLKFPEAVTLLAELVGLPLPVDKKNGGASPEELAKIRVLYSTLEAASDFYQKNLTEDSAGSKYLNTREILPEIVQKYALGYAPNSFDAIKLALARVEEQTLLDTGLLSRSDKGHTYDKFRDRIMFPIKDIRGRVIAFGGRVVSTDQAPKYMNSPQSIVYNKSKVLYGLYEAWKSNTALKSIMVVEGYMDVITLAQYGIENAVAPLGTALTTQQIQLILKFSSEYILCFDGDEAGATATWRAIENGYTVLKKGQRIRIVRLPRGDDPDSYIRKHGVQKFQELVARAPNSSAYFFKELQANYDLNTPEGTSAFVERAREMISRIPYDLFRDSMYRKLQDLVRFPIPEVADANIPTSKTSDPEDSSFRSNRSTNFANNRMRLGERNVLRSLIHNLDVIPLISTVSMRKISNFRQESIVFDLILRVRENELDNLTQLLASYEFDSPEHRDLTRLAKSVPPEIQEIGLKDVLLTAVDTLIFRIEREVKRRDG